MSAQQSNDSQEKREQALKMSERRGIPVRFARQVVEGNMTMGQVMRKLMQRRKMEAIAEKYGISRSLAGNVAVGEMTVEQAMMRQKFHRHFDEFGERTLFEEQLNKTVVLEVCSHERHRGEILSNNAYEVEFQLKGGTITVPKLQVKFGYPIEHSDAVRDTVKLDKKVRSRKLEPIVRIEKRYHIKNRELIVLLEEDKKIECTTLEGEVIRGALDWFSRYEISVEVAPEVSVYLMRHAIISHRQLD